MKKNKNKTTTQKESGKRAAGMDDVATGGLASSEQGDVARVASRSRNPRRSSIPSRVVVGLDESFAGELLSDDDDFFGSDDESDDGSASSSESHVNQPSAHADEPSVSDSWISDDEAEVDHQAAPHAAARAASTDVSPVEVSSMQKVLDGGCSCSDEEHILSLPAEALAQHKKNFQWLSRAERDIYLCGLLAGCSRMRDDPYPSWKQQDKERERSTYDYSVMCYKVCRDGFMKLYSLGQTHVKRLQSLVKNEEYLPRPHGHTGQVAYTALPVEVREHAEMFIRNYARSQGLPMPAAPRGRASDAPIYLPTSTTYVNVHAQYKKVAAAADAQAMGYDSFRSLWHKQCSDIRIMQRREDVCAHCEHYRAESRAAKSEDERMAFLAAWTAHIVLAQDERCFYNAATEKGLYAVKSGERPLTYTHITFDFSENYVLPYHARQPGPVYFKVMFRVNDFGIVDEGKQHQHYMYTEAHSIGPDNAKCHGPNNVISMIHHYLTNNEHSRTLHFHCDNCVGQNKNKTIMAFMAWRILAGLEDHITISFMVVGHTRCAVDAGFGLAKKKFRASDTDTYEQLLALVSESAVRIKPVTHPPRIGTAGIHSFSTILRKSVASLNSSISHSHLPSQESSPCRPPARKRSRRCQSAF